MKRAILMVRVSSDEQAKGYSLDIQERSLRDYCNRNSIDIVGVYREDHSAQTFNRPEFKKLLEFVSKANSKIDYLFFTTWDRFSRNTTDSYEMLRKLNKLNIEVQAVEQYIDFSIPENKFLLGFYLSFPHIENERRGIKIFGGIKAAKQAGRWPGKGPFGYKNTRDETNKPIIIPDEKAEIVKKIFSDFSKGKTQVEIRLECRKLGFAVSKSQFSRILSNPAYIGKVLVRDKKNDKGYYINGIHTPIISLPLFEKVLLLLDGNKKKRNMPKVQTIKEELYLRSHLLCPNCGNNMTGSGSKSKTGHKHHYYHCNYCHKVRFRADGAHKRMLAIIEEINFSKNANELYNLMVKKIFQVKKPKRKNSEETIIHEISLYQKRITNLQDDYADRKISLEDYNGSIERYRQKNSSLTTGN